jgi:predicted dehydrogenase
MQIGIIGAGEIVRQVHLPVLLGMPGVRVAWLFDAAEERAAAVGAAYGIRVVRAASPEDLPACDVALIAIPLPVREPYLREMSERGTAVFCEKPFALGTVEHARYIEWFAPHALGVGYMRRFYRSTRVLQHLLGSQWFGPLQALHIGEGGRSRGSGSARSFLEDRRLAGARGVLMDLGTHTLDLALQLVAPTGFVVRHSDLILDGDVDRHAAASIALSRGAEPAVALDWSVSWLAAQANTIELRFRDLSAWCGIAPGSEVFIGDPARPAQAARLELTVTGAVTANQAFFLEWQEFLRGVERRETSAVAAVSALQTTALAEAIRVARRAVAA